VSNSSDYRSDGPVEVAPGWLSGRTEGRCERQRDVLTNRITSAHVSVVTSDDHVVYYIRSGRVESV